MPVYIIQSEQIVFTINIQNTVAGKISEIKEIRMFSLMYQLYKKAKSPMAIGWKIFTQPHMKVKPNTLHLHWWNPRTAVIYSQPVDWLADWPWGTYLQYFCYPHVKNDPKDLPLQRFKPGSPTSQADTCTLSTEPWTLLSIKSLR